MIPITSSNKRTITAGTQTGANTHHQEIEIFPRSLRTTRAAQSHPIQLEPTVIVVLFIFRKEYPCPHHLMSFHQMPCLLRSGLVQLPLASPRRTCHELQAEQQCQPVQPPPCQDQLQHPLQIRSS